MKTRKQQECTDKELLGRRYESHLSSADKAWVRDTLSAMSEKEKLAQVLMPLLFSWEKNYDHAQALDTYATYQVGGAFTFSRDWRTIRAATSKLTDALRVPPLFSCDYECGPLNIQNGARFGMAMTLAAIKDIEQAEQFAYEVGAAAALQGRAVGARWTFAPVVDVCLNRHNPIVNTRSYGDDPERIRRLSLASIRGLQEYGMAATLKHFPGDGVDSRDQHLVTTVNDLPAEAWDRLYRGNFEAGIDAGVSSIMMGHIALAHRSSRNDKGRFLPATLDPRMHDMLREEFGFEGVIISDAINMGGISGHLGPEPERVLANLKAGSDVVLFVKNIPATMQRLERALEDGELETRRVDEAVHRLLMLKAKLRLHELEPADDAIVAEKHMDPERFSSLAVTLNTEAMTLIRNDRMDVPLKLAPGACVLMVHLPNEHSSRNDIILGNEDRAASEKDAFEQVFERAGYHVIRAWSLTEALEAESRADAIIYCSTCNPEAGRGSIRLTKEAYSMMPCDLLHTGRPVVFVSFGTPYTAWELEHMPCCLCAYSAWPVAKQAAARAILGEIPCKGVMPVAL